MEIAEGVVYRTLKALLWLSIALSTVHTMQFINLLYLPSTLAPKIEVSLAFREVNFFTLTIYI